MSDQPWRIHESGVDGIVFRAPDGKFHCAYAIDGRHDLECMYGFSYGQGKAMEPGQMWKADPSPFKGELRRYRIEYPASGLRLGKCVTEHGFHGFRVYTPGGKRVDYFFTLKVAPIELQEHLTRLFAEPGKEQSDAEGKLAQEPVPQDGGAEPGEGQGRSGEGRQEPGGIGQAGGQRDAEPQEPVGPTPLRAKRPYRFINRKPAQKSHRSPPP